jgi:hypothetical protein
MGGEDSNDVSDGVPLAYAGEREADLYRTRYKRLLIVTITLASVLVVFAIGLGLHVARDFLSRPPAGPQARVFTPQPRVFTVREVGPPAERPVPLDQLSVKEQLNSLSSSENSNHRRLAAEWRLMHAVHPAGRVAYEEDPRVADRLRGSADYGTTRVWVLGDPQSVTNLQGRVEGVGLDVSAPVFLRWPGEVHFRANTGSPKLFIGVRQQQDGVRRLVVISLNVSAAEGRSRRGSVIVEDGTISLRRALSWSVIKLPDKPIDQFSVVRRGRSHRITQTAEPGENVTGSYIRPSDDRENSLRFFTGHASPDDPAGFIIPYEIGPADEPWHRGRITGHLKADGTVALALSTGRFVGGRFNDLWQLPVREDVSSPLPEEFRLGFMTLRFKQ